MNRADIGVVVVVVLLAAYVLLIWWRDGSTTRATQGQFIDCLNCPISSNLLEEVADRTKERDEARAIAMRFRDHAREHGIVELPGNSARVDSWNKKGGAR